MDYQMNNNDKPCYGHSVTVEWFMIRIDKK